MKRLFLLEYLKIKKTKSFWILAGLFVFALLSIPISAKYFMDWMATKGDSIGMFPMDKIPLFDFVDIWQNLGQIFKYFSLLLGFLIVISITNEFSYKTMRQNIIDGLSKREFLLSKLSWVFVLSAGATFIVFIIGLIMGFAWSPVTEPEFIFKNIDLLFAYFLHIFSFLSFCMFLSFLMKRAGIVLAFIVFYTVIIEPIISGIFRYNYELEWLADAMPYRATMSVIQNPFGKYLLQEVHDYIPMYNLAMCLLYIGLFIFGSWILIKKRDL